jgi:hypothetical protein
VPGWIDLSLKIVATLIAAFGVWKYFADRTAAADAEAQARALRYIERFGSAEIVAARMTLLEFWRDNPEYLAYVAAGSITRRERDNFVRATYSQHDNRSEIDGALFRMAALFDEIAYCRTAGICGNHILDEFFCGYTSRFADVYAPFFSILSAGMAPMDGGLTLFNKNCHED